MVITLTRSFRLDIAESSNFGRIFRDESLKKRILAHPCSCFQDAASRRLLTPSNRDGQVHWRVNQRALVRNHVSSVSNFRLLPEAALLGVGMEAHMRGFSALMPELA